MDVERERLRNELERSLDEAVSSDAWGQRLESAAAYSKLVETLEVHASGRSDVQLSPEERACLSKLSVCLGLRLRVLNEGLVSGIGLEEMRKLIPVITSLYKGAATQAFPVDLGAFSEARKTSDGSVLGTRSAMEPGSRTGGTLLPPPNAFINGGVQMSIRIEKIGLKDATQYIEPFITVSVMRPDGSVIDPEQDTPVSTKTSQNYVQFDGVTVELQTPINTWPKDACVFLEFKHFKPKKNKISTRCWAFLEADELKEGPIVLEIYRKPTDPRHRKLGVLSKKPLYMHVHLTMHKH